MPSRVRPGQTHAAPEGAWRRALREAVRSAAELGDLLDLDLTEPPFGVASQFPLLVPRSFVERMRVGNPADPLLLQVVPRVAESTTSGLPTDAVGDLAAMRARGLIQKYRGRALLTVSGSCAVNCRYCFRRGFPYEELPRGDAAWTPAIRTIAQDASLSEVILSGGDPLVLGDQPLRRFIDQLGRIQHVRRLRIHSRLPVVIPDRVTEALCETLARSPLHAVVVLHINHPNEIDSSLRTATDRLRRSGIHLLNQAVLLRDVNDSVECLEQLSVQLFEAGVLPYYLHQLDLVRGAEHFEVSPSVGVELIEALRDRLPGYLVPKYVKEIAGMPSKVGLV